MSSFRQPVTIVPRANGALVDGIYTEEAGTPTVIQASIQPTTPTDIKTLPEGKRESRSFKLYSDTSLTSLSESQTPDRALLGGVEFEIVTKESWQNGVINHYKYIVVKI